MNSPSVRLKIMSNSYLLNSTVHPHPQHNGKTKQATIPVNRQDAMNEPARVFSSIEATLFFFSLLSLAHTKRRDAIVCNWSVAKNRLVCDTLAKRCDCRDGRRLTATEMNMFNRVAVAVIRAVSTGVITLSCKSLLQRVYNLYNNRFELRRSCEADSG